MQMTLNVWPGFRFATIFLLLWNLHGFSQVSQPVADSAITRDSLEKPVSWMINELAGKELIQSSVNFREHRAILKQSKNFFLIKDEIEKAGNFLSQGFQSPAIRREIAQLIQWN